MRPKLREYKPGDPAVYAHVKLDGHMAHVRRGEKQRPVWKSKTDKPISVSCRPAEVMPTGISVLGELWVPGQPASYVSRAIASRPEELQFTVFAVEGITSLHATSLWCAKYGFAFAQFLGPRDGYCSNWLGELDVNSIPPHPDFAEGWVLKDDAWTNWRRLKPCRTIDLIVTGLGEGNGKYLGLVGSLKCSTAEGIEVANVSGFDYETRVGLSEADIGRVVEVKYQYVGAGGRLRHPTFVRWRDDKLPQDCTLDQDERLNAS